MFDAIGASLRAIPGPTPEWADIIGHIAWPVTLLILFAMFRDPLGKVASTLVTRIRDDHIKLGDLLELTPRTQMVDLDEPGDASDGEAIERLFEFIVEEDSNFAALVSWLRDNVDAPVSLDRFMRDAEFSGKRRQAVSELMMKGG